MATAAVTYTFAPLTDILSSEANTNFDDLVVFLNTQVIQKDASVAFTGTPSGPATDPVSDNQYSRKAYVDKTSLVASQVLTSFSAAYGPGPVDTDFVLSNVPVDVTRAYEVCLHSHLDFTSISQWQINLHVNGANAFRLDHKPIIGGDGDNMTSVATLWLPATGTPTLRVNVTRLSGAGTIAFEGAATAPRSFWVKDIGPR